MNLCFTDVLSGFSGRDGDDNCKRSMERLLNIWQERNLYRADFIQQLKLAIEDSDSPKHKPAGGNARVPGMDKKWRFSKCAITADVRDGSPSSEITVGCFLVTDEKKNLKRSYQKIQEEEEEEDDDYRGHYSPGETDAAAPQLVRVSRTFKWFHLLNLTSILASY